MSLRTRLILSYSLIIVLCLSIVALAASVMLQGYRDRFAMKRLDDMTVPIYVQARALVRGRASPDEVWTNLEEQAQKTGVRILMIDGEGNIIRQASPVQSFDIEKFELPPEGLSSSFSKPYHGTYRPTPGQTFIFVAYPLSGFFAAAPPPMPEALVLAVPRPRILTLWAGMIRPFLWAGLIALSISIVIAILLARSFYRPVHRVAEAARQIAQGDYDQKVPVGGPSEIRELAFNFNQMAKQVKQSQQRLRDFVADVSHELRSPLTSIRGFAQAILDGTAGDSDTQLKAAQVIKDESRRVIGQVDELLEFSRMQSGQIQMAREAVDLKELLELCQEIFSVRAKEKKIVLKAEFEPLTPIAGDSDRLEQVFSNLLDNALKHTPEGGEVRIIGRQPAADSVEIRVADNGPGIPPDQLSHVFERFYQVPGVRTGSGLGLAIAREIVWAHSGTIEAS
ncbi:MAG: HAMP domain-containing sensor histidine kinase, partial [Chloroflexota bacterium]|nr:HAMP domain-containing sensor histidine kinase [Chloroflexota bacterium]